MLPEVFLVNFLPFGESLGEFYNTNCNGSNTYEIYYDGSEVIHKNKKFKQLQEQIDLVFTSPPYFNREEYSTHPEQSYIKYPNYQDWLDGFLDKTDGTEDEPMSLATIE